MILRTVARDTESVRTISLIDRSCSKYARRISPILSTPTIPIGPSRPIRAKGKDADTQRQRGRYWTRKPPLRGSLLQAILRVRRMEGQRPPGRASLARGDRRPDSPVALTEAQTEAEGLHCSGERSPTAASARDASQASSQSNIGPIKSPGQLLVGAASDRTPSFSVRTLELGPHHGTPIRYPCSAAESMGISGSVSV